MNKLSTYLWTPILEYCCSYDIMQVKQVNKHMVNNFDKIVVGYFDLNPWRKWLSNQRMGEIKLPSAQVYDIHLCYKLGTWVMHHMYPKSELIVSPYYHVSVGNQLGKRNQVHLDDILTNPGHILCLDCDSDLCQELVGQYSELHPEVTVRWLTRFSDQDMDVLCRTKTMIRDKPWLIVLPYLPCEELENSTNFCYLFTNAQMLNITFIFSCPYPGILPRFIRVSIEAIFFGHCTDAEKLTEAYFRHGYILGSAQEFVVQLTNLTHNGYLCLKQTFRQPHKYRCYWDGGLRCQVLR